MPRIIGADVCKSSVVFCCLDSENLPKDYNEFYRNGDNFFVAHANIEGLKTLIALQPDVVVLEPTGVNYSRLWIDRLGEAGIRVVQVPHQACKAHRTLLGLPDKDDPADALTLGLYYLQYADDPRRFVINRDALTYQLRDRALRLQHLVKVQNILVNRLKQDMAYCFPERQDVGTDAPLFWGWLAGQKKSVRYDAELARSIGLGITEDVRVAAKALYINMLREKEVEKELVKIIKNEQFDIYRSVFARYGFGQRGQAIIISQIFPLSNFLDPNGRPKVERSRGRISKKPTVKHLSERRVIKMLGLAPVREQSGSSLNKTKKAGSGLCRVAFWLWCFCRIERKKGRLKGALGDKLVAKFIELVDKNPTKLARSKFHAYVARQIFYDLVAELKKAGGAAFPLEGTPTE
jgi:transposase